MMWYGDWGWGGWLWSGLMMLAFLATIAAVVVVLLRRTGSDSRGEDRRDPARILDERFARGEIDEEEYRARRKVLREGR